MQKFTNYKGGYKFQDRGKGVFRCKHCNKFFQLIKSSQCPHCKRGLF